VFNFRTIDKLGALKFVISCPYIYI